MATINKVREDLRLIRYYYVHQASLTENAKKIGSNAVVDLVEIYNEIIRRANPKFYELYICLYVDNNTQEWAAEDLGYSLDYLHRMNKELLLYIQSELEKKEKQND